MIISVCSFTEAGQKLQNSLEEKLKDFTVLSKPQSQNLKDWVCEGFMQRLPLVFIGAAGIAVRAVAPFVRDKLSDSPVLVIDEKGKFVVPVLSGHVGGGNELAREIAEKTGGTAVITTATDVENKFSVDVFARKNGLKILNRDGIRKVSEKVLRGEKIPLWISPEIKVKNDVVPEEVELICGKNDFSSENKNPPDVCISSFVDSSDDLPEASEKNPENFPLLRLKPKTLCLGIGCKRGKSFTELKAFLEKTLTPEQIDEICSVSSIDLKKNELGLQILAQYYNVPFLTYSAEELKKAEALNGEFSESDFVKETTGVSNVCERSAVLSAGNHCEILLKKTCGEGITLSLSEKSPEIITWRTK